MMSVTFGIRELKPYQKEALVQFFQKKKSPIKLDVPSRLFIKLYRLFSTQFLKLLAMLLLWFCCL